MAMRRWIFHRFLLVVILTWVVQLFGTASAQETFYVTSLFRDGVIQVNGADGRRTVVSGPMMSYPKFVARNPGNGNLYVTDDDGVYMINASSGAVKMLSGPGLGAGPAFDWPEGIAVERAGTLVVVDSFKSAVFRVNPTTGNRTILSGGSPTPVGSGPAFSHPVGIAVESNGLLVVADNGLQSILRVDPVAGTRLIVSGPLRGTGPTLSSPEHLAVESSGSLIVLSGDKAVRIYSVTGNRTVISGPGVGSGPNLGSLSQGIAVESNGSLLVASDFDDRILSVNPTNGNRAVVSGGRFPDPTIGSGPEFDGPLGIAVESTGSFVVVNHLSDDMFRVNRATGNRTRLPNVIVGTGPECGDPKGLVVGGTGVLYVAAYVFPDDFLLRVDPWSGDRTILSYGPSDGFVSPKGVARERTGTLVVVDSFLRAVIRVDPRTGNAQIVSKSGYPSVGSGPDFFSPDGIAVEANGNLVVTDSSSVMRVHPVTGDRSILSDSTHGAGQDFYMPRGIAVEANGSLVVADHFGLVTRVHPVSGNRSVVSGGFPTSSVGSGPTFRFPTGISVMPNGTLIVADGFRELFRVNPANGNRVLITSDQIGSGPLLRDPEYVAIAPPPTGATSWNRYR